MCLYYLHGQKLLGSRCVIRCRQRFFQAFHRTVTIQNQILKAHFFVKITICWLILREICTCHVLRYTSGTVINFRYVIHLTKGNLSLLLLPDRRRTNYCSTTIGRGFESWRPSTTAVQLTWQSYDVTVTATALRRPPCRASKRLLSIAWKLEQRRGVRACVVRSCACASRLFFRAKGFYK